MTRFFRGLPLFAATIFLSAFLLFQVQPMIAKAILPWFGGSAAVWITCMLFFQIVLLLGYLYAHFSVNRLGSRMRFAVHTVLLAASLLLLPVIPSPDLKPASDTVPLVRIVVLLAATIGLQYFLLSTTSPLLQAWYSEENSTALPYRLFALSNLASLIGLVAYPVLVEPVVSLERQSVLWSAAYAMFAVLCAAAGAGVAFHRRNPGTDGGEANVADAEAPPSALDRFLWFLLSGCASLLLLAVTNHLTQNVASIPFLWVVPLSLYLLTFIFCFDRAGWYRRKLFLWVVPCSLGLMGYGIALWMAKTPLSLVIPSFSGGLFLCCMFCHGELANRKPPPRHLTSFYLMMSFGGALGGLVVGLAAPALFSGYFELPAGLVLCALLFAAVQWRRSGLARTVGIVTVVVTVFASFHAIRSYVEFSLVRCRNFYGTLRVFVYEKGEESEHRSLVHGAINHGTEFTAPERRLEKTTYYSESSGVGLAFGLLPERPRRAGMIGLGAGTLAAYGRKGDFFRFYEINPDVLRLARQEFYYLAESPATVDVVLGDGRLSLEREAPRAYDILVVDAFSGDSIPVHLITREAFELYFRHLAPRGILALHVTNTHLDLGPVVERLARESGRHALLISDSGDEDAEAYASDWVLVAADPSVLASPALAEAATALTRNDRVGLWSDDYNNLFRILK